MALSSTVDAKSAAKVSAAAEDFFNIDFFDIAVHNDEDEGEEELVKDWLKGLGLSRYVASLQYEGFDHLSIINDLDDDSIDHFISICMMPRLHARQFRNGLERLRADGTDYLREKLESDARARVSALETKSGQTVDSVDEVCELVALIDGNMSVASCADEVTEQENNEQYDDSLDEGKHKRRAGIVLNKTCSKSAEKKRRRKVNKVHKTELEADAYVRKLVEGLWKSSKTDASEAQQD